MIKDYYCNCEADCLYKAKKLKRIKVYKDGKVTKKKAQVCTNKKRACTCKYRDYLVNAFLF